MSQPDSKADRLPRPDEIEDLHFYKDKNPVEGRYYYCPAYLLGLPVGNLNSADAAQSNTRCPFYYQFSEGGCMEFLKHLSDFPCKAPSSTSKSGYCEVRLHYGVREGDNDKLSPLWILGKHQVTFHGFSAQNVRRPVRLWCPFCGGWLRAPIEDESFELVKAGGNPKPLAPKGVIPKKAYESNISRFENHLIFGLCPESTAMGRNRSNINDFLAACKKGINHPNIAAVLAADKKSSLSAEIKKAKTDLSARLTSVGKCSVHHIRLDEVQIDLDKVANRRYEELEARWESDKPAPSSATTADWVPTVEELTARTARLEAYRRRDEETPTETPTGTSPKAESDSNSPNSNADAEWFHNYFCEVAETEDADDSDHDDKHPAGAVATSSKSMPSSSKAPSVEEAARVGDKRRHRDSTSSIENPSASGKPPVAKVKKQQP
ncbi:hypothetical protein BJ508DRAFT_344971 [Ascobolus immersus RN42]|uniref:Uncharacterized protein n=1 Tax=Ascobolus immersus RN42 TaxID=1160509 RepID=A0A3N4ILX3_ASCIM|nr:hypothetical protein BJ508DRAFT_344971 [Ascobolus immersus RN42]